MNSKDGKENEQPHPSKSDPPEQSEGEHNQAGVPSSAPDGPDEGNDEEITIEIEEENGLDESGQTPDRPPHAVEQPYEETSPDTLDDEPLNAVIVEDAEDEMADEFFELVPPEKTVDIGQVEILERQLQKKTQEAKDNFERLVRFQAEFENFKKRHYREKQDFKKYCLESIMLELLPSLDNLQRALGSAREGADISAVIEGIEMIHRGLSNCLTKFGLKSIETKDKIFDPAEHEAMMIVDSTDRKNNAIIEEFQKGYFLHDRVIRPSLVSVAKYVAAVKNDDEEPEDQIQEAIKEITQKMKISGDIQEFVQDDSENSGNDDLNLDEETNNN